MSAIKVLNMAGAEVGTVELNDAIFGVEPNMSVVHEVVKNHLANCRQGTQSALTRAEVSGGGIKYLTDIFRLNRCHEPLGSEVYSKHGNLSVVKIPCSVQNGAISADDDIQGCALCNSAPRCKLNTVGNDLGVMCTEDRANGRFITAAMQNIYRFLCKLKAAIPVWIRAQHYQFGHFYLTVFRARLQR